MTIHYVDPDIGDLGASLNGLVDQINTAIAGLGGGGGGSGAWARIDGGEITSPTSFFDVSLPTAGYKALRFISSLKFGVAGQTMVFAFSSDGGATFFNDLANNDSYIIQGAGGAVQITPSPFATSDYGPETGTQVASVLYPGVLTTAGQDFIDMQFDIAAEAEMFVWGRFSTKTPDAMNYIGNAIFGAIFNQSATVTPSPTNIPNLMRVLPYGNGDVNPPTSADTISQGYWTLLGLT